MTDFIEWFPRQGVELYAPGQINHPYQSPEPRPAWWVSPLCFVLLGIVSGALMVAGFLRLSA